MLWPVFGLVVAGVTPRVEGEGSKCMSSAVWGVTLAYLILHFIFTFTAVWLPVVVYLLLRRRVGALAK